MFGQQPTNMNIKYNNANININKNVLIPNKVKKKINGIPEELIQKGDFRLVKDYYKNKDKMNEFLAEGCDKFNENFELIQYLSCGSCGLVFEGKEKKNTKKSVGLKFLLNNIVENKRECKNNASRVSKELNLQQKLRHKNISKLFGYYEVKNCGCIAMEFAKYGDLDYFQRKLIEKKTLSETAICYFALQILNAIKYCHELKVVHMDVKQQNLLVDENLNIKLTDFSVSQSYEDCKEGEKISFPVAGTSLYMSPEILGKVEIAPEDCNKIDMFSLGVVLYNMAFGNFPYELDLNDKKNFRGIYEKLTTKNLNFPTGNKYYSNLFRNFISGLLNKNIKHRMGIYDALEDPWIKGADIILKEKDKINDLEKFLINIVTDNIKQFNEYLKNYKPELASTLSTTLSSSS